MLGTQLPLPGVAPVRLLQSEELVQDGSLVPVSTYYEEGSEVPLAAETPVTSSYEIMPVVPEGTYNMDHNTLWFIANGSADHGGPGPAPRPYRPAQGAGAPQGPCFKCGEDHWIRDYPLLKQEKAVASVIPPLIRYCVDCGVKHFVQDCPERPEAKGKATLNFIEVVPSTISPSSSESEKIVPIHVITRARAKETKSDAEKGKEVDPAPSESSKKTKETWKARRVRRAASRKKRNKKVKAVETKESETKSAEKETKIEPPQKKANDKESAGSVLTEKHFEHLDALLQAYEARLKPLEILEERWQNYPDPAQEARQLEIFKRLTEAAQALEEQLKMNSQPTPTMPKETGESMERIITPPSLEPIDETNI